MKVIKKVLDIFNRKEEYNLDNAIKFINSQNFQSETDYFIW